MRSHKQVTVRMFAEWKRNKKRFVVVTAYDYTSASLVNEAGIPVILVGDSLGMTTMGMENTLGITLDDMVWACKAVKRGSGNKLVVADMPFMTAEPTSEDALMNAARLVQEGGAHAVKLEGGNDIADRVDFITQAGIPVIGHIGIKPQFVNQFGKYRKVGGAPDTAQNLLAVVKELEDAGAVAVVLELVDDEVAKEITAEVGIPTIGIGSGFETDAQVQVFHDLVGLTHPDVMPKHTHPQPDGEHNARKVILGALAHFRHERSTTGEDFG